MVSAERLRADVVRLLGPRSRLHAPEVMAAADRHVAEAWREAGWTVEERPFALTDAAGNRDLGGYRGGDFGPTVYPRLEGRNLVAIKEGRRPDVVLVAAHLDTIRDSPGADDNTASIAALLELARVTATARYEHTVMLVAFDMEEIGFHGSRVFVRDQLGGRAVRGAIVFETMAYTSHEPNSQALPRGLGVLYPRQVWQIMRRGRVGDFAAVLHRASSTALAEVFATHLRALAGPPAAVLFRDPVDLPLVGPLLGRHVPMARNFCRSDHQAFWDRGWPAILVTDTANFRNPHYHAPTDTPETLDFDHLRRLVEATRATLDDVAGRAS